MKGDNKKKRLAKKADKAHTKAKKKGETAVGTRKTMANPRTLTQGSVPVYKKEAKIREKIAKKAEKKKKRPKQSLVGRVKDALTSGKKTRRRKSKTTKARTKQIKCRIKGRNKRKHASCKA